MKRSLKTKDGTYLLTQKCGSLRHMAPGKKILLFQKSSCLIQNLPGVVPYLDLLPTRTHSLARAEVWKGTPYNETCDVYSFSLILWSIMSLKTVFLELPQEEGSFVSSVTEGGYRPKLKSSWSPVVCEILENGWSEDIQARPCMEDIKQKLKTELVRLRKGDDSGIGDDERRRSTFVFDMKAHMASLTEGGIMDLSFRSGHSAPESPRSTSKKGIANAKMSPRRTNSS